MPPKATEFNITTERAKFGFTMTHCGYGKWMMLIGKCSVAALLLIWVLGKVHFRDYVVDKEGRSYSVSHVYSIGDGLQKVLVSNGRLWWTQQLVLYSYELKSVQQVERSYSGSDERRYVRPGVLSAVRQARVEFLLIATILMFLQNVVASARWMCLLRIQDIRIRLWDVLRLWFLGLFFSTFVPGTFGGDFVRLYHVAKRTPNKGGVFVNIFLDRILGLFGLAIIAAMMLIIMAAFGRLPEAKLAVVSVTFVWAVLFSVLLFLFSQRFRGLLHLRGIFRCLPFGRHLTSAGDAMRIYRNRPGTLLQAMGLTFLAHAFFIATVWSVGVSLSVPIPWYHYILYVPLIYIIGSVPLTPGGIGIVEDLFVVFFAAASPSLILALALLMRLLTLLLSSLGMIVGLTSSGFADVKGMHAELATEPV